jgi:hypothetical protein
LKLLTIPERTPTARDLGERLRVTAAEWERLKLWQFKPIYKTDDELAELARARRNSRRRQKARAAGVRTREAYMAELASRPRPWITEGITQRTWQRRRQLPRGEGRTIVLEAVRHLATPNVGDLRKEGHQGGVMVERPKQVTTEAECAEANAPSSPELGPDPATDPRIAALSNWGGGETEALAQAQNIER